MAHSVLLWKQPSFKQTSETVSDKRQITQWVPGSWAGNSKCSTPIRAETVSRHNTEWFGGEKRNNNNNNITLQNMVPLRLRLVTMNTHSRPPANITNQPFWFICFNYTDIIWRSNNIQLIIMLQLEHNSFAVQCLASYSRLSNHT